MATAWLWQLSVTIVRLNPFLRELIDNDGERLTYQLALADMELSRGHIKTALAIYEKNQASLSARLCPYY